MYIVLSSDLARFCIFKTFCHLIYKLINHARPRGAFAPKRYEINLSCTQYRHRYIGIDICIDISIDIKTHQPSIISVSYQYI